MQVIKIHNSIVLQWYTIVRMRAESFSFVPVVSRGAPKRLREFLLRE